MRQLRTLLFISFPSVIELPRRIASQLENTREGRMIHDPK